VENSQESFQLFWETSRQEGRQISKYPYDKVISFVFRHYPRNSIKADVKILEIGCGAGNNLWPLAKEGFQVYGIDGSATVIKLAEQQFKDYGLTGYFCQQDFTHEYPFENNFFDLVIDRGALTCVSFANAVHTISHIFRVMKKGGFFFFNPYSMKHSSYTHSQVDTSNNYIETNAGTIAGVGKICFYDYESIQLLFKDDSWELCQAKELVYYDYFNEENIHAEWEVVSKKL
jgi:SAM-dependent methyltransferase